MIKIILLTLVLMIPTEQPKTELKAMDEFFDKLLQNATPTKENCLKYEDCPEWDGNPDTKVWYDLMKLKNGINMLRNKAALLIKKHLRMLMLLGLFIEMLINQT